MLSRLRQEASGEWARRMAACPQDPRHHAEGDVWTHTMLVVQSLVADPAFAALPDEDQHVLLEAALWHDVAKPACTVTEPDGSITARGHARRGELMVRRFLWENGWQPARRELVCKLIRHHMAPFFLVDEPDWQARLLRMGLAVPLPWLQMLARADARGRVCSDGERLEQQVELFGQLATDFTLPFPDAHSRLTYFRKGGDPARQVYDDCRCTVVATSGLPASGKDYWIEENLPDWPRISLDDLRDELEIRPSEHQGPVIEQARLRAREYLRQGRNFVWNATNLSAQMRSRSLELFYDYGARVRIVYLEAPAETIEARNAARPRPVPAAALERMLDKWEPPDLTEAHQVDRLW